jgi:GrpB-like predicted nucleotidyltransferase (UPF0157 family)
LTATGVDGTLDDAMQGPTSSSRPIIVCDYDEQWPAVFEQIARPIREAAGELDADVEHVGSTAVGGLRAKPVIDIDVVDASPAHVSITIDRLSALGYRHEGDLGIPGREALMAPPDLEVAALSLFEVCRLPAKRARVNAALAAIC